MDMLVLAGAIVVFLSLLAVISYFADKHIKKLCNENEALKESYGKYQLGYRPGEDMWHHYDEIAREAALATVLVSGKGYLKNER